MSLAPAASAQTPSLCAAVRIDIQQELTLERQAFDAHMRINNGLANIDLTDIGIAVRFQDADGAPVVASTDPDDTDAAFYIRLDRMDGVDTVDGGGTIAASSEADIHWLIVPAPGSGGQNPMGTLYSVGADLTYNAGGDVTTVSVTPDVITVRPMPRLTLDYFLPGDVYADDPFTAEIEPSIPFSLGVRVRNNGHGAAANLKIDSARPRIVDNDQGLLVSFTLLGSSIDDEEVNNSLLVDFGTIPAQDAATARWLMATTLSGEFVEFGAIYTHADALGGELTSLIEATETHTLVHDVLADLPGRDAVRDFLAVDGSHFTLYESSGVDSPVADHSSDAVLDLELENGTAATWLLTQPAGAGFSHVRMADPHDGAREIVSAIRSDGKHLPGHNAWRSRRRNTEGDWEHFLHLFDVDSTGSYRLVLDDPDAGAQAPVLQFIPDRQVTEGQTLAFLVEASDADGDALVLSASPLPAGARLEPIDDNAARLVWTPAIGQGGSYAVTFRASDGEHVATQGAVITVLFHPDADGDGLPDDWEIEHFGDTGRDGSDDFDGDGISDLAEYEQGFDPTVGNRPDTPWIVAPLPGAEIDRGNPELLVELVAGSAAPGTIIVFQVLEAAAPHGVLHDSGPVPVDGPVTGWTVPTYLVDNVAYHWRARTVDGTLASPWRYGDFLVNTVNDAPAPPLPSYPPPNGAVDSTEPVLVILSGRDADDDELWHRFAVFDDPGGGSLVVESPELKQVLDRAAPAPEPITWTIPGGFLTDDLTYYWHVVTTDVHGESTAGPLQSFTVAVDNGAPSTPAPANLANGERVTGDSLMLEVGNAVDPDGDSLEYTFELDTVSTFDSPLFAASGPIAEGVDTTAWQVSGLAENTRYHWRARASDGTAASHWSRGSFFVDTVDEDPGIPAIVNPGDGAWFDGTGPRLALAPGTDPDHALQLYEYELYADPALTEWVAGQSGGSAAWSLAAGSLEDDTRYYWRARSADPAGNASDWTAIQTLFVNDDGAANPPRIGLLHPSGTVTVDATRPVVTIAWQDGDRDSDATLALYYDTDATGFDGTLIADAISEDDEDNFHHWDTTGLTPGAYHVYALITDGETESVEYATGTVVVGGSP